MTASAEWGTPVGLWDRCETVLGKPVSFDPCSSHELKKLHKNVSRYMTANGEKTWWPAEPLIVNPPGGGLVKAFWTKTVSHTAPVIWIGFNIGQLATLQDIEGGPLRQTTVVLRKRIKFVGRAGSPRHENYLTLTGDNIALGLRRRFIEEFCHEGVVTTPY